MGSTPMLLALLALAPAVVLAAAPADDPLLAAAGGLVDPRSAAAARAAFAATLAESDHPDALAALLGAAHHRLEPVRAAAVSGLARSRAPGAVAALSGVLSATWGADLDTRVAAAAALGDRAEPAAGEALYAAIETGDLPGPVQRAALAELEDHYAALLAARGRPTGRSDPGAGALVGLASAAASGVVLSSVGVWADSDVAVVIGAVGGAGIGGGLGGLWAYSEPFTLGQSLRYGSDTLWGVTAGALAGPLLLSQAAGPLRSDASAGLRALGAGAGALSGGLQARRGRPDVNDVLEQDLAGILGVQAGVGVARVAGMRWVTDRYGTYRQGPSEAAVAGGALAGAAVGLGGAALLREPWQASGPDLGLGAVVSAETAVLVGAAHVAAGDAYRPGSAQLGSGLGALGGLALAEALSPTGPQVAMAGWGGVLGNALGAGVPLLVQGSSDRAVVGTMLPVGLAGTVGGGLVADALPLDRGDAALLGFAVPLAALEGLTIGTWASERSRSFDERQLGGLVLTASAATGLVVTGLGPVIAPDPGDVGMVASITAWGAYHGAVVPLALDTQGTPADLVFASTLTADGFLVLGSVLASPAVDLEPRRTLVPQVGGLTGATLGSLGALLVRTDPTVAARGALAGSTVGFLVGGAIEAGRPPPDERKRRMARALHLPDLPGDWGVTAAPLPGADGTVGLTAEVRAVGW